ERRLRGPRAEELHRLTCRRLRETGAVEDAERAVGRVIREDRAERGAARLAVHLDLECPRGRRKRDAAAGPVRRPARARAGAAGALLAPGLRASAGDQPAAIPRAGTAPARAQLCSHALVPPVQ